jgi:hypothetical protein
MDSREHGNDDKKLVIPGHLLAFLALACTGLTAYRKHPVLT